MDCELSDDLRRNLAENVMPFWAEHAWDAQYGGFLTRLDRCGKRLDESEKYLIMQCRMIGSLAWAHESGLQDRGYLLMAEQGFSYLIENFRDHQMGGFHFSVHRTGEPLNPRKNTDAHAYAMIGLCALFQVSRREDALRYAEQIFDLLEEHARDGEYGYREDFDGREWEVLNADQMHLTGSDLKTVDMHTNVMEAYSYLAEATGNARHMKALRDVMELIVSRGIDREHHCSITACDRHWNPVTDAHGGMSTSYGINVELAWLIQRALTVLGENPDRYRHEVLDLVDHALMYGFDSEKGGIACWGPMTGATDAASDLAPDRRLRAWWIQAELLNALIGAYRLTGAARYRDAFVKEWEWIRTYQVDHECGDWYQEIDPDTLQPVSTDKGKEWKTAFHVTRALIQSATALEEGLFT